MINFEEIKSGECYKAIYPNTYDAKEQTVLFIPKGVVKDGRISTLIDINITKDKTYVNDHLRLDEAKIYKANEEEIRIIKKIKSRML